jgi:hypothetical protein
MNHYIKTFSLLLTFLIFTNSCDNSIPGCIDPDSDNYNELADTDDGSCEYSSDIYLWWDQAQEDEFDLYGVTSLTISIDGFLSGSITNVNNQSWTTVDLSCENPNNMYTSNIEMPSADNKTISILVEDQDGEEIYNEVKVVEAKVCHFYKIVW